MLVLSRRGGQSVRIGKDVLLTVVSTGEGRVRIGFEAPANVGIDRYEIWAGKIVQDVGERIHHRSANQA